ncbi:MAG: hypothetical protein HEEMFOPI_00711 [Holosporales bacterium]
MPHFFFTIGSALMASAQPATEIVSPASTEIVSQASSSQTLFSESSECLDCVAQPRSNAFLSEEIMIAEFFEQNRELIKRLSKIFLYTSVEFYCYYQREIQSILFTLYHARNLFSDFFRVDPQGAEHVIADFIQELSKREVTYRLRTQKFIDHKELLSCAKIIQRIIQRGWYQNLEF